MQRVIPILSPLLVVAVLLSSFLPGRHSPRKKTKQKTHHPHTPSPPFTERWACVCFIMFVMSHARHNVCMYYICEKKCCPGWCCFVWRRFGTVEPPRTHVTKLYTLCYLCNNVVREGSTRFDVLETPRTSA